MLCVYVPGVPKVCYVKRNEIDDLRIRSERYFFPFATLKSNFLFTSHFELYFSFFEFFSFSKIEELLRIDTVLWFDTR